MEGELACPARDDEDAGEGPDVVACPLSGVIVAVLSGVAVGVVSVFSP